MPGSELFARPVTRNSRRAHSASCDEKDQIRALSSGQSLPVVAGYVEAPTFHEHPEGEEDLGEVVHQQDVLQLVRLPILHKPATEDC